MAANGPDGLRASIMGQVHRVAARNWNRETREICDVRQGRGNRAAVAEVNTANPTMAQVFFEFVNDEPGTGR